MQLKTDTVDLIVPNLRAIGSKQILKDLAQEMSAKLGLRAQIIYNHLQHQMQPGRCSISGGVMIVDALLSTIDKPFTALSRLSSAYDFQAADGQPVDLIVLVLSPEREKIAHLQTLAGWSRRMKDTPLCSILRRAEDADDMHLALASASKPLKAAA